MPTLYSLIVEAKTGPNIERRAFSADTPFHAITVGDTFEWEGSVAYRIAAVRHYVGPTLVVGSNGEALPPLPLDLSMSDCVTITLDTTQNLHTP